MEASVSSAASSALEELLEVSPQVDAAVIVERDGGRLLASAPATSDRMADRLGATCMRIVEAAEQARRELGREPVVQVEVATPEGHVFVVADATWLVAAVTDADPTVGLVFYDLKTSLRAVREAGPDGGPRNGGAPVGIVTTDEEAATSGDAAGGSGDEEQPSGTGPGDEDDESQPTPRWRRRRQP